MREDRGVITVFLSMVLLVVSAVILVSIEGARGSVARARGEQVTKMAMESCFSCYVREIFDDYGLLMAWKTEEEMARLFDEYAAKNCRYRKEMKLVTDFLAMDNQPVVIEDVVMAADDDGRRIDDQIYDYMKLAVSQDVLEKLLGNGNDLSQNEQAEAINEKIEACSETLEEAGDYAGDMSEQAQAVRAESNPVEVLEKMQELLEEIRAVPVDDDHYNRSVRDNLFGAYKVEYRKYVSWEQNTGGALTKILTDINDYLVTIGEATERVSEAEAELEQRGEHIHQSIREAYSEELGSLKEELTEPDPDRNEVVGNKEPVTELKKIINSVSRDMDPVREEMEELDYSGNPLSRYDTDGSFTERMYECVVKANHDIEGFDAGRISFPDISGTVSRKKNEIVDFVKKLKKEGIMGYIVSGEISKKKISDPKQLPSHQRNILEGWSSDLLSSGNETMRNVLLGQYIFDHFHSYTDQNQTGALDYEIEYLLEGKGSDRENLKETADAVIAVREGFNFAYLMKDTEKREHAYEMAAAIVGFTGIPAVVRVTQMLILAAWSYAESVVDVRDLLDGKRVKLMKEKEDWNLSWEGIKTLTSTRESGEEEQGLCYEDYLRFLILSKNRLLLVNRILDVIQLNMNHRYQKDFRVSDCILEMEVEVEYRMPRVFSDIGFLRRMITDRRKEFVFEVSGQYGY